MTTTSAIGQPVQRVDGPAKVTGQATYSAEFAPPGLAYAATADSRVPAGTIIAIDTEAAEGAPGVILVLTHHNTDRLPYHAVEPRPAVEPVSGDQLRVLQDAQVRFSGQPIAVVVADSQAHAEYAAGLIEADIDPAPELKTQFDANRAVPTSPAAAVRGRGSESIYNDPDAALLAAPVRVTGTYVVPREHHNPMEPHATIASWDGDQLTLWSKTQWVGNHRDTVAAIFGLPAEHVHVINPYIGGAFGSGLRTWPHVTLAALAARRIGRPVRLELTRRQMYTSVGFRPQTEQRVELGADPDGRLLVHVQEAIGQTSTYEEFAEATLDVAESTYPAANRRTSYRLVPMHVNTPSPMRGPGHATGLVAQEMAMDELAAALDIDPIALRVRNFARRNPRSGLPWSSNHLLDCYRLGAQRFSWPGGPRRPRTLTANGQLVGYGMATAMNISPRYPTQASVTVHADGTATVRCATSDMGPGTYTAITQVAADELGLAVSRVRFDLGDSAFPAAKEHGGSTTLASVGSAVQAACAALRTRLDQLAPSAGTIESRDAAARLLKAGLDSVSATGGAAPGDEQQSHSTYSFGAVFAEVHVDPDLGEIRVPRIHGVYDIGRVVNPALARSQIHGGMVGGLGMALLENTEWDEHLGRVINADLAEYLIPVCADIGRLDAEFLPVNDPAANPLGSKGVAELGLCGVAPAIANAVWHATGRRVRQLPISLDSLLTAGS